MSIAFVLGNGVSRGQVNLPLLKHRGQIYGCNALYRDFEPDVLVATDRPIADQIQAAGYALQHKFYTRKPITGRGARSIPEQYYAFSSGPVAVALAAEDRCERIYLIGFDLGSNADKMFNNLYAGTEFYKKRGAVPTYTGNWVRQIIQISKQFSKTQFSRVCGATTARSLDLDALPNMTHLQMSEFLDRINNQKDL
jgi:hypothetical protein